MSSISYLGHRISEAEVKIDPDKTSAITDWPLSSNLKQLRGFLGLSGYYRKFVKDYASVITPLTNMLCKDGFTWTEEGKESFEKLKIALSTTPILKLPISRNNLM